MQSIPEQAKTIGDWAAGIVSFSALMEVVTGVFAMIGAGASAAYAVVRLYHYLKKKK